VYESYKKNLETLSSHFADTLDLQQYTRVTTVARIVAGQRGIPVSEELEVWVDRNQSAQDAVISFASELDALSTIDDGTLDTSVLDIMSRILDATDEDAIFAAANAGTKASKMFLNTPFRLPSNGITWKKSGAQYIEQGGFPWYALTRVIDLSTGEEETINGGGLSYVTTLYKLWKTGTLARYDADGGMPLILEGKPAVKGSIVLIKPFKMPIQADKTTATDKTSDVKAAR
jgi:hypothetical protein